MKKLIIFGVATFAFALTANVVFAKAPTMGHDDHNCNNCENTCCPSLTLTTTSNATIANKIMTLSNTGLNLSKGGQTMDSRSHDNHPSSAGSITTGNAEAMAEVGNGAGDATIKVTMPAQGAVSINTTSNANIGNMVITAANTGKNKIGKGSVTTGYAGAQMLLTNVVGTSNITINK